MPRPVGITPNMLLLAANGVRGPFPRNSDVSVGSKIRNLTGNQNMDFIERWFGLSPDGGDGTLELLYIGAGGLVVISFACRRWITRHLARHFSSRFKRQAQ